MSSKLVLTAGTFVVGAAVGAMLAPLTLFQVFIMLLAGITLLAYAWKEVK